MCGIAGYSGGRPALAILTSILKRLEYRGYDSAGISLADTTTITTWKRQGDVESLRSVLPRDTPPHNIAIAHTRWATHGEPSDRNAHPLHDCHHRLSITHNGVIDNHIELRTRLQQAGHRFESDTDSEVVAHMMEEQLLQKIDPVAALAHVSRQLQGTFALAILIAGSAPRLLATRVASPLVVGLGEQGVFISSDAPALHGYVTETRHLSDYEIVSIVDGTVEIGMPDSTLLPLSFAASRSRAQNTSNPFDYGEHSHYMHKELWEQPAELSRIVESISSRSNDKYRELRATAALLNASTSTIIAGCGSSYLSGQVARYWIEDLAGMPVELDIASELAYRNLAPPQGSRHPTALLISQSGETADVLAALATLRKASVPIVALTNVADSELQRQADIRLVTDVGPEIAVASTKTFTAQLTMLAALSIMLGRLRGKIAVERMTQLLEELASSVGEVRAVLEIEPEIRRVAMRLYRYEQIFVLGRHVDYALAQEMALKLREVAYVGAQGYAAAELKHGNLALFTPETPAICIDVNQMAHTRMASNIEEIRARYVPVITVNCQAQHTSDETRQDELCIPCKGGYWSALPTITALHLLTYHIAVLRGCPVDHPRNLAKSSTVQ